MNIQKKTCRGCAYNDKTLWLSIENSNTLIAVDSENNEDLIPILDYDNINIMKMVTGQDSVLVLEGSNGKHKSLFVFDCKSKEILFVLLIKKHFIDIVIMIMDNLSCHKVKGVAETIEAAGASVPYLPLYSPNLNPIEIYLLRN